MSTGGAATKTFRIACLVDGFNLYHSVGDAIEQGAPNRCKWLNIRTLCESKLPVFKQLQPELTHLFYFTSLASHRRDGAVQRHQAYIKALTSVGFETFYGSFKGKQVRCEARCRELYTANVEKQTDVNVALKLIELFHLDACDGAIVISGDGDLLNAIKTSRRLFENKLVTMAFPYRRWNAELSKQAHFSTSFTRDDYEGFVFNETVDLGDGKFVNIPTPWRTTTFSTLR